MYLARSIPDKLPETFALAGILTFTDKIISESMRKHIEEVLSMTQVGQMLMDRGRKEGRKEGRREGNITALYDLYNAGDVLHERASRNKIKIYIA